MKILICPDKFKQCLRSGEVAKYIYKGICRIFPQADCMMLPLADGGEGTVEALVEATEGKIVQVNVHDPFMRPVSSFIGISGDGKTAVIEMAAASGLALIKPDERNPMITSTYGTGELIRHALDRGCTEIILGIGGSATVDGGVGMAQALGISFTDDTGWEVAPGGGKLGGIYRIDLTNRDPRIKHCKIFAACDVTNPLTGPRGASHVYGPQKGATPDMVIQLDVNLKHMARVIQNHLHIEVGEFPGAGAAGGMGAGIVAFLGGQLKPGFELISQIIKLDEYIAWADLVITGEGKMDAQTSFGKAPAGVARLAAEKNKPVLGFTGSLAEETDLFHQMGFTEIIPITNKPMTTEQSIELAGRSLEMAAERTFRLIELGKVLRY
jgi:glycerate kinase